MKRKGDFNWNQQAEDQSGKDANFVEQDGYQVVNSSRVLGNFTTEISAVGLFTYN